MDEPLELPPVKHELDPFKGLNLDRIPQREQKGVLESFWTMMREVETKADENNDQVLKIWVEGFYRQWNRITRDTKKPTWISRAERKPERSPEREQADANLRAAQDLGGG